MKVLEENEGIMSKSPQILAQDLHLVMAAVLEADLHRGKRKDHHRSCRGLDILAH
jgi:hypothetical protein